MCLYMVLVFSNSKFPLISLLISVIFFLGWHKNMWFDFLYVNKCQGVAALAWLFYIIGIKATSSVLKRQRIIRRHQKRQCE